MLQGLSFERHENAFLYVSDWDIKEPYVQSSSKLNAALSCSTKSYYHTVLLERDRHRRRWVTRGNIRGVGELLHDDVVLSELLLPDAEGILG